MNTDLTRVFRTCRYCGDMLDRARAPLETCEGCENSPLCDRCGHPRGEHTHVYTRGGPAGCNKIVGDFQSLRSWRCTCEGFRPVTGSLADATFATDDSAAPPSLRTA